MLERTTVQSPFYTAEHEAFREVMRRFVAREIEPYAHEWDEVGEFPRELYRKASEIGLLGLGFPVEYGGGGRPLVTRKVGAHGGRRARTRRRHNSLESAWTEPHPMAIARARPAG